MTITIDVEAIEVFPSKFQMMRLQEAKGLVESASRWSFAVGLIPIPVLDAAVLAAVQTKLLMNLSALYGEKVEKERASAIVSVLLGSLVPLGLTKTAVGTTAKIFPGSGTVIGSITMATMGAAATKVIGQVSVRHFERGGTFLKFREANLMDEFRKEFKRAEFRR
jgi:GTP-binding protein Era